MNTPSDAGLALVKRVWSYFKLEKLEEELEARSDAEQADDAEEPGAQ